MHKTGDSMKIPCLAGFLLGVSTIAGAAAISNFTGGNGYPLLIPGVQKFTPENGSFRLPERFTILAPEGEKLVVEQISDELKRFPEVRAERVTGKEAVCRLRLTDHGVPEHDQGYTLRVGKEGFDIASRGRAGLFYGVQTLRNILRNNDSRDFKFCRIEDWPDLDLRYWEAHFANVTSKDFPALKRMIDALASVKINSVFSCTFDANFPYRDTPFTGRHLTEAEVKELLDFCKERHMDLAPGLQVLTHAAWMWKIPGCERFWEAPPAKSGFNHRWNVAYCPNNEEACALVKKVIEEQIDMLKPRQFLIMLDEIFLCPYGKCPKCKADPFGSLARHIKFAEDIVLAKGVTPVVYHCSFVPRHLKSSPAHWTFGEELGKRLNPKTLVLYWAYEREIDDSVLRYLHKLNRPAIGHGQGGDAHNMHRMVELLHANNGIGGGMCRWYYSRGDFNTPERNTAEMYGGLILGATYLWNKNSPPPETESFDPALEMRRRFSPRPLPEPGKKAQPIPLGGAVNAELSTDGGFPVFNRDETLDKLKGELSASVGNYELLTAPGGKYYGVVLSGSENDNREKSAVTIPLGIKANFLSFLLTTSRPFDQKSFYAFRHYGVNVYNFVPVAYLEVKYADGTSAKLPLRYRFSITDYNQEYSGYDMRFAVRGTDDRGVLYSLGAYDFENPHPDKEISSVTFSTARYGGIAPALLAVSAFGMEGTPPAATFSPERIAPVAANDEPREVLVHSFNRGRGRVRVLKQGDFSALVRSEVVQDPEYPHGKVLKVTVPPAVHPKNYPYVRISIDMPYKIDKDAKSLYSDIKISSLRHLHHANDYLMRSSDGYHWVRKFFPETRWQRNRGALALTPVEKRGSGDKFLEDVTTADRRLISFFFEQLPEPVEIYFGDIGESPDSCSSLPLRRAE